MLIKQFQFKYLKCWHGFLIPSPNLPLQGLGFLFSRYTSDAILVTKDFSAHYQEML